MKTIIHYIYRSSMMRYGLVLLVLTLCIPAVGQTNNNHLMFNLGALYERGFDATVAYEHGTKYHNAWEFFGTYYIKYDDDPNAGHITRHSFWYNYRSWHLGICYKPCVVRRRNHHGNFRLGVSGGSDTHDFLGGIHAGYEHSYSLYNGWEVYFQVKSDAIIKGEDLFRTGAEIGCKIPL